MTRKDELAAYAESAGLYFRTYSPGDGVTRYRFFLIGPNGEQEESYFGPGHGVYYTAVGLKEARAFIAGRAFGA